MEESTTEKELNSRSEHDVRGAAGYAARRIGWLVLLPLFLAFGGCELYEDGESVSEERERSFQRGKQLLKEGRHEAALESFQRVIEKRPGEAPESHLETADIFLNEIGKPVEAIHHYRRYLEQKPRSPQAELVRGQIDRAMKELAGTLPARPLEYPMERLDLQRTVEELERENRELKSRIAALRDERDRLATEAREATRRAEAARREAEEAARARREGSEREVAAGESETRETRSAEVTDGDPPESTGETYTVRPGDSLYGISRKVYGTGNRWHEIYEANSDILPDENSVRIGMTLRIPRE